jgi:hypothetical protein
LNIVSTVGKTLHERNNPASSIHFLSCSVLSCPALSCHVLSCSLAALQDAVRTTRDQPPMSHAHGGGEGGAFVSTASLNRLPQMIWHGLDMTYRRVGRPACPATWLSACCAVCCQCQRQSQTTRLCLWEVADAAPPQPHSLVGLVDNRRQARCWPPWTPTRANTNTT